MIPLKGIPLWKEKLKKEEYLEKSKKDEYLEKSKKEEHLEISKKNRKGRSN